MSNLLAKSFLDEKSGCGLKLRVDNGVTANAGLVLDR
jgi:hypothetical protein